MLFNFLLKKSNFIFKPFGLQLSYISNSEKRKYEWLKNHNIDSVIDIGANQGQFALKINSAIKPAVIYCFEPTTVAFTSLEKNTRIFNNIKRLQIGIGDSNKKMEININSYSPSSSILALSNYHKNSYPDFLETTTETIQIATLDSLVADQKVKLTSTTLLKIDVQGFEKFVLLGAKQSLKVLKMVYLEVSFIEMYANQPLFGEVYDFLIAENFVFIGADNLASDEHTAQPLFFDAYFIRKF
ncbi:MAG: FkbM family methyltransferase [Cytophagales bacterium]